MVGNCQNYVSGWQLRENFHFALINYGQTFTGNHLPSKIFPVKALQLEPLVNDNLLAAVVSDRDSFLGLIVYDFPLFLTSRKRPLHAFSDSLIYMFAVCNMVLRIYKEL